MTVCRRNGQFDTHEAHQCFVLGCNASCEPAASETCPACNFKKCTNGHCACDVPAEVRTFLESFYNQFCDHARSPEMEHAQKIMVETWYFNCCLRAGVN
jgi:hypothetical protein